MSETQTQALLRFIRVVILAAIGAGAANVTVLKDVVTDPIFGTTVIAIVLALLEAGAKLVGGATAPVAATSGIRTFADGDAVRTARPNILAI